MAPGGGTLYYLSFLVLVVRSVTFGCAYMYILCWAKKAHKTVWNYVRFVPAG